MNKAIIFDLDGTIIDSAPDILDNLNIMLENYGYPKIELKRVTEIIGHGARNLVKGAVNKPLDEKVLDEYLKFYNNIYTANANKKTILYDGIMETIKKLRDMGYKLAICTNKPQMTLDA